VISRSRNSRELLVVSLERIKVIMLTVREQSRDQNRYNEYGKKRLQTLREARELVSPDSYVWHPYVHADIVRALGPTLHGKELLELGCGAGEFSVFCAKQGGKVTGVDIGLDLVRAAREWATINGVLCEFQQANIIDLPAESSRYDIVVGLAVLHHLSESDLNRAVAEAYRVLRCPGRAVFFEPVENGLLMEYLRNTIPQRIPSKYGAYQRPSIWQRQRWKRYLESVDDRYLSFGELNEVTRSFSCVTMRPKNLFLRSDLLPGRRYTEVVTNIERLLLERFPRLSYFCSNVLVECQKEEIGDV
jgi:2-polyprenyl-3-methyl-5-hydroxy-6-metoxy-1,4-benzoquinol methylase